MAENRRTDDPHVIDIVEYEKLRGEIDTRTQIAHALVAADLTALGVAVASIDSFPDVIVGISVASIFLWMLWIDVVAQVWKLAAYVAIELAPRLRDSHPGALGWEAFVRQLDKGGEQAREALRLADTTYSPPAVKMTSGGLYSSLLLGGPPADAGRAEMGVDVERRGWLGPELVPQLVL